MRWTVAVSAAALFVAACGGDDVAAPVESTVDRPYSIVNDDTYDGVKFFDESVEPYDAYPELEGWVSVSPNPVGNGYGAMQVYRRTTGGQREDLVVMYTKPGNLGVDGLRLTGDTSSVHLILSCEAEAVLLIEDAALVGARELSEASRAWRPGPSGALEEIDPASGEPTGSC